MDCRAANADDYVALELSEVTEVNSIIFEQGEPGAGDKFNFVKFQSSMDGENWTDIDGVAYGPEIEKIVVENLNVKAKYVRVVPTGEIKSNWISVREFSVNKDDTDHIKRTAYTNVSGLEGKKVDIYPTNATLEGAKEITLEENEYVGIKLNKIREITNIIADFTNNDKLTLETSINGVEWTAVSDKTAKASVDARYVRIINKSENAVKFDLENLAVEYSDKDVTFDVRPAAEAKFEPSNLIDGKLNTAFKPQVNAPKTGSLLYKISENTDIANFTIIQDPSTISEAVVSVRNENGWSEVGTLSKNMNIFDTSNFENVLEIKVEWDGVAPTLKEIVVSTGKEAIDVNKEELESLITEAEKLKAEDYTADTWKTLEEALNSAKEVLLNTEATQEEVDNAVDTLKAAIEALAKNPGSGDNNGGNNNGNNGNNGENNNGNDGNVNEPGKGNGDLPNTGGTSPIIPLAIGGLIVIAGIITLRKKTANN